MHYDPRVPKACAEDDALEVRDKKSANFCDYFKPSADAYRPGEYEADLAARDALSALFSDTPPAAEEAGDPPADADPETPSPTDRAEALFKD
jgi:hypothetical protein